MAFNLTYDPSDDPTALAEAEQRDQENFEIGDQLEQEQSNLLAGKYRDAEELEQAYIELQRKLGSKANDELPQQDQQETEVEAPEEEDDAPIDYSFLNRLAEEADSGEFSDDTIQALDGMSASDVADMFLAYRQEVGTPEPEYKMNNDDISEMKSVAGGEQEYSNMIAWASENLSSEEIQVYDSVMDKGDPQAIYFAIQALNYRFKDSVGYEGQMLTGRTAQSTDVFRSQAEVVRAMNDARYDNDPAYRQDIYDKLERSNLNY
jgi:hypothetical protein